MTRNINKTDVDIIHKEVVEEVIKKMPDENMFLNLANILDMTKSSISHQLANLRRSGIVRCKKVGKEVLYKLDDEHITKLFEVAVEHILHRESLGGNNES